MKIVAKSCIFVFLTIFAPTLSKICLANSDVKVTIEKKEDKSAGLAEEITLKVNGLTELVDEAEKKKKKIIPYLDGYPLKGVETHTPDSLTLKFILKRTEETKEVWRTLLGKRNGFFTRKVTLSVGLENGVPVTTDVDDFELIVIKKSLFYFCLLVIFFILILLVWLARASEILRDSGPQPVGGKRKTYSLARTQMAFWFFLVISSYLLIWLITGDLGTITESVLGLMGIGAGTALGAGLIDSNKRNAINGEKQKLLNKLLAEEETLRSRISELNAEIHTSPTPANLKNLQDELNNKQKRYNEILKQLDDLPDILKGIPSEGFLFDILTDANGISFHRFQMLVWTIVLGIIFGVEVYNNLNMPDFSGTLLALMGISSGTYIGFKFPEQPS